MPVSRGTSNEVASGGPAAGQGEDVFAFPASFAQRRLWFLEQVTPQAPLYNIPVALRLEGPLDVPLVARALQGIVDRHESLRTTFGARGGSPLQIVTTPVRLDLPVVDLRHLPAGERRAEAQRLSDRGAREPFRLDTGPLIRASMFVLGDEEHVLFLCVHHIVCDGWSLGVMLHELSELYRAFAEGRPPPLPDVPVQYPDYTLWQIEHLEGEELERQLTFWREHLAGELPVLELPGDRPRPALPTHRGGWIRFALSAELTAALGALARREGTSLYMTLLAAFSVLLHRLSGQAEVLVGSPAAGRDRPEIERSVGFHASTLVFRTDLSGEPTFRALVARVKETALSVYANQDAPLDRVALAVNPHRSAAHHPLFQAMLSFQRAPELSLSLPGVAVEPLVVHSGTSKFDLLLEVEETPGELVCFLEYCRDLFDEATAGRFTRHFHVLLEGIARDPDRPVGELPLLTAAEREELLTAWNATEADHPRSSTVHDLIAARAALRPDEVAVEAGGRSLTYGELMRRSSALAAHLRSLGAGPGALAAVFVDRTPEMVIALLGALASGAAYVPVDPSFPAERIAFLLADAKVSVVLTTEGLASRLPPHGARVVWVDREGSPSDAHSTNSGARAPGPSSPGLPGVDPGAPAVDPGSPAYVIYTSGSTGQPKGVVVPHRALTNLLTGLMCADSPGNDGAPASQASAKVPVLTAKDRLLAVTTLSFDIAALELFLPLVAGGTVIVAPREVASDGARLLALMRQARPTVMQATPATWRMLIDAGWEGTGDLAALCGGEAWPPGLAAQLLERASKVWNMYGPTETTIWSTCARITDPGEVHLGRPVQNTQVYVLDAKMEPVPFGVTGEIHIGGDGVALGYLGRPELTRERFVPDPFRPDPGARLYRTGDLARRLPGGGLVFLGRADSQVKVRGFRVELGEIEAALARHPAIREQVVAVRDDGSGDRRIVAYVVVRAGQAITSSELRRELRRWLPDAMVPHLFVELPALPRTPNGKIDRRALPDPLRGGAAAGVEYAPPRTALEALVASVFREVLGVERVGLRDNFFDLGGHSLLSMQAIHRIEERTGHRLGARSLVFQSVEQLAAECAGSAAAPGVARAGSAGAPRASRAWSPPGEGARRGPGEGAE